MSMLILFALLSISARANPVPETVLFMGSSSIVNWEKTLPEDFPGVKTISVGKSGTDFVYLIENARQYVRQYDPDRVVIYSGDNDLANKNSPELVSENFERTVQLIRDIKPETPIYIISVKPSPGRKQLLPAVRKLNALIRKLASKLHRVTYVDVFSRMIGEDGQIAEQNFDAQDAMHIHLSPRGYDLWTSILKPYFRRKTP